MPATEPIQPSTDTELLCQVNEKLDFLLSKLGFCMGKNGNLPILDTPAKREADINAVVLRYMKRKNRLKKDA